MGIFQSFYSCGQEPISVPAMANIEHEDNYISLKRVYPPETSFVGYYVFATIAAAAAISILRFQWISGEPLCTPGSNFSYCPIAIQTGNLVVGGECRQFSWQQSWILCTKITKSYKFSQLSNVFSNIQ